MKLASLILAGLVMLLLGLIVLVLMIGEREIWNDYVMRWL